jgi:Asp/Glu/hydantoin racemase
MTPQLLLLNPNTSANITARLVQEGEIFLASDVGLTAVTAREGTPYIATRADLALAGSAALAAYREVAVAQEFDAVLLGCFGDPGLTMLREEASCPVVSLADAACAMAAAFAKRFSVLTGGTAWISILQELFSSSEYASRITSIRAIGMTGDEIVVSSAPALALLHGEIEACVREDGADAIIIGGAGLAGLARRLAPRSPVPLIDSVAAGICYAQALARMRLRRR